ncbi:complement component 1 Q subcomponent-binding protein, mitochondrial [Chelonus insularis]|uniref:complement component 1 Q subcomponent-binding protein, mitochondrial n=1 Tax=Chelonus insularis TaxID=460826 RepID=UPI0015891F36|nr:complement component 1 Q subcomponent-binding protein, mitochondrial [Chelonus insularis]
MSGIIRNKLFISALNKIATSATQMLTSQAPRSMWYLCKSHNQKDFTFASNHMLKPIKLYSVQSKSSEHTKAEKELIEFLAEEIVAEKKAQKLKTIPTELDGFKVSLDGANVTLEKKLDKETITITFNINHTVDTDTDPELDPTDDKPDIGEMKSKPNFNIDIVRGNRTLGFSCSFNNELGASGADDNYNDCFGIDEVTVYKGVHNEQVYSVAGEVIDGYLYDLLMNYLEEKGISNEFAEKLIELSTSYEHSAYISLLEGLVKFTSEK